MDEIGKIKNRINIRDINSYFMIKNIFKFLSEKQFLKLIMYNKLFQNLLSVDIKNYQKISEKYKIGGRNGAGKVFLKESNILIFEGEYLNGKRNGKGTEYNYDGKIIFEGEYLNGKRWNGKGYNNNGIKEFTLKNGNGKGKIYNYYGKLEFEGEYKNGKRNGKGKEYNYDGKLIFEGEYLNGKSFIGKGKEYNKYNGKIEFEGEYLNGERNGRGKEYNLFGKLIFEGEYKNGERTGKGKEYNNDDKLIFDGEYLKEINIKPI